MVSKDKVIRSDDEFAKQMQLKFKSVNKTKFDNKYSPRVQMSKKRPTKVRFAKGYGKESKDLGPQGSGVYSAKEAKRGVAPD